MPKVARGGLDDNSYMSLGITSRLACPAEVIDERMPIRFKGSTRHRAHRGTDFVAVFTLRDDRKAFACRCAELTNDRHTKPPPQFVERVSAYFVERKWFAGKLIDHTCTSARRPETLVSGSNLFKNTGREDESEHVQFA